MMSIRARRPMVAWACILAAVCLQPAVAWADDAVNDSPERALPAGAEVQGSADQGADVSQGAPMALADAMSEEIIAKGSSASGGEAENEVDGSLGPDSEGAASAVSGETPSDASEAGSQNPATADASTGGLAAMPPSPTSQGDSAIDAAGGNLAPDGAPPGALDGTQPALASQGVAADPAPNPVAIDPAAIAAFSGHAQQRGFAAPTPGVTYQVHVARIGWMDQVSDGAAAGVKGSRIEALRVQVDGSTVRYRVLVQDRGWTSIAHSGADAGTTGKSLCVQAVRVAMDGPASQAYNLYYRVYVRSLGWLPWTTAYAITGTNGFDRPLDQVQFALVKKGSGTPAAGDTAADVAYITRPKVSVWAHVQRRGWMAAVGNGAIAGTTGKSLRMEAVKISITSDKARGGAEYASHVQRIGWQDSVGNGKLTGTTGKRLRMEALDLGLTGQMADCYDVFYRVHVQRYGWMGWAKACELAGSSGRGLRVEAVQVHVVLKGGSAPSSSSKLSFVNSTNIMGPSDRSAADLARWYQRSYGSHAYPAATLKKGGAGSIGAFTEIVSQEAAAEGVRAEVVFAQMMFETGYLQYGGLVKAAQYNFCGLKTAHGKAFQSFSSVREGVRAHVQHLKAYASTKPLANACVDPRFSLITRGVAPNLDDLSGRWSGEPDYGARVNRYLKRIESSR